jgi:hypothetical protein
MDAMSDAVDMAAVVLFGVSLAYKESASEWVGSVCLCAFYLPDTNCWPRTGIDCRLEANYAHQQEKDSAPRTDVIVLSLFLSLSLSLSLSPSLPRSLRSLPARIYLPVNLAHSLDFPKRGS